MRKKEIGIEVAEYTWLESRPIERGALRNIILRFEEEKISEGCSYIKRKRRGGY